MRRKHGQYKYDAAFIQPAVAGPVATAFVSGVGGSLRNPILQQSTEYSEELESAFSEQPSSLDNHTHTNPTRLLERRSMMSIMRNTLLRAI